jgi:arginine repressor
LAKWGNTYDGIDDALATKLESLHLLSMSEMVLQFFQDSHFVAVMHTQVGRKRVSNSLLLRRKNNKRLARLAGADLF